MSTKIQNNYDVPSAVLHIRSIPQGTTENDLFKITFDHKFGKCVSVRILERFHQALLEMDSVESATRLLKYSQKNSLLLHGKPVQISFSKSQSINQPQSPTATTTSSPTTNSTHRSSPSSPSPSSNYNGLPQAGSRQSPNTNSNSAPIAGTVLLSTIENPGSNIITIDHLYHAFSSCGEVLRIVMFNKNNLQALIEFSAVDSALHAKKTLSGHSLFHGGQCTLKLEVSKTDRLNITQNTDRAKDFSKPLPTANQTSSSQSPMSYYQQSSSPSHQINGNNHHHHNNNNHHHSHSSPSQGSHHHHHHHHNSNSGSNNNHHNHHHSSPSQHPHHSGSVSTSQHSGNHHNSHGHNHHGSHHQSGNLGHRTTVLLVHGLDDVVMTCDRIFNLFCVYGNVQRVKILSSKKGAALVQMEDVHQAEAVIRFYHQMSLFKDTLQINYSKHLSITDSHNPESPTLSKDFSQSNLNRFTHPINTYKHLYKPSQTLYFSNVPKDFTEANFNQLFQSLNLQKPIGFKIFSAQLAPGASSAPTTVTSPTTPTSVVTGISSPSVNGSAAGQQTTNIANNTTTSVNGISSNSSTPEPSKHADKIVGLLEFTSPSNAVDALVLLNNSALPNSNHMGLRLSFSNSTVLPKSSTNSNNNNNNTNTNNNNNITSPQQSQPQQFQQSPSQPKHF
ncbi:hypothetical protein RB653_002330 [Dictyostelium firmibasis]|uniref:RRM domain-containing protein n=1 Tax=Dictyostelium firmibasis TaxID=79012 RepID=A0AAN7TQC8_9MYCE